MAPHTDGYTERSYVCQDNLTLYYRDYGPRTGPRTPLLCLGGLTRNSKDFHDLALRYAPDRHVVCPDYRGRGRSEHDPDWRRYNAKVLLGDVIQLLAATNLHKVVLVGTSLGGILAMVLAVAQPRALAAWCSTTSARISTMTGSPRSWTGCPRTGPSLITRPQRVT